MTAREVTFIDRLRVAELADILSNRGGGADRVFADELLNCVRCCDFFPECSHVLAWVDERDAEAVNSG